MRCSYCGSNGVLYCQINGNGARVVIERCPKCRCNTRPGQAFLPAKDYDWEKLPLFEDNTKYSEPCSVKGCKNKDVEWHHFAPRHLFSNADDWPAGWLCTQHHRQWHALTKTGSYARRTPNPLDAFVPKKLTTK